MPTNATVTAKMVLVEIDQAMARVEKAAADDYIRRADDAHDAGDEALELAMLAKAKLHMQSAIEYEESAKQHLAEAKAAAGG